MSKFGRMQVLEAATQSNDIHARLIAAYWVSDDDTRDYLVAEALKSLSATLAILLGKQALDAPAVPEAAQEAAP